MQQEQKVLIGINVGNQAPEIALPSPSGDTMKLSSLRGKYVLLDFWATWCRPCRMFNPHLVKMYRAYKDSTYFNASGFTVYSVALENPNSLEKWKNVIASDSLEWKYHVSEFKGWYSYIGRIYQINSIPANYLLDEKGVIVGKNLTEIDIKRYLSSKVDRTPKKKVSKKKNVKNGK